MKAQDANARIIVFCNQKRVVQEIANSLWGDGLFVDAIHGDKSQAEREYALAQFKKGGGSVLFFGQTHKEGKNINHSSLSESFCIFFLFVFVCNFCM